MKRCCSGVSEANGTLVGIFFFLREDEQILLRVAVDFALPAFDRAVVDRERVVGHREAVIDVDHAAEAAAFRAGAERGVEGEERGRGGAEGAAGLRRMQAARVVAELGIVRGARVRRSEMAEEENLALAEVERGFDGFEEARLLVGRRARSRSWATKDGRRLARGLGSARRSSMRCAASAPVCVGTSTRT